MIDYPDSCGIHHLLSPPGLRHSFLAVSLYGSSSQFVYLGKLINNRLPPGAGL